MNEKLRLPASCTRLGQAECTALEGGCLMRPSTFFAVLARMVRPQDYYAYWKWPDQSLQEEHGKIIGRRGNLYTYADGFTYQMEPEPEKGLWGFLGGVADFFYDIGL